MGCQSRLVSRKLRFIKFDGMRPSYNQRFRIYKCNMCTTKVEAPVTDRLSNFGVDCAQYEVVEILPI